LSKKLFSAELSAPDKIELGGALKLMTTADLLTPAAPVLHALEGGRPGK
jgi:hypothetical protein